MKIKLFLILFFTIYSFSLQAQFGVINREMAEEIVSKETIIVLSNNDEAFNKLLKYVIADYWTLTEFIFKKKSELKNVNGVYNLYHDNQKNYLTLEGDGESYYNGGSEGLWVKSKDRTGQMRLFGRDGYKGGYSLKYINDLDYFKSDTTQIKLAVQFIQNHIREALNNDADITYFGVKSYYYQSKKTKLDDGCILIFENELSEVAKIRDEGLYEKYDEKLSEMKSYVKEKSSRKLNIIDVKYFDKEYASCPYLLERQLNGSGGAFILYDLRSSEVVNIYKTKNSSSPYYNMAWRKALKTLLR